jgi:hypothetical protein
MTNLRIGNFFETPEPDYDQPGCFTWKEFYDFRNHVLRVLRRFGSAGPMGEVDLSVDADDEPEFEDTIVKDPDFFVVDDMYNEHDRLCIVECDPEHIKSDLIQSLSQMAIGFPDWYVSFSLGDSGLRVSAETMLRGGRRFWDCETLEQIAERCARPVDYGLAGPFPEAMYSLWVAVVSGEFRSSMAYAEPPDRQWTEAILSLQDMCARQADGHLRSFAYDQIRYDIHPETRRQLVLRFLGEVSSFSPERLTAAKRNVEKDAGEALSNALDQDDKVSLARRISLGQQAVAARLNGEEVVFWWPNVVHSIGSPSEELRLVLVAELRGHLKDSNPMIQLSAVFGLALLRINDIASVVDEVAKANGHWFTNQKLTIWLEKLKAGSTSYPSGLSLA